MNEAREELRRLREATSKGSKMQVHVDCTDAVVGHLHAIADLHRQLSELVPRGGDPIDGAPPGEQLGAELDLVRRIAYRGKNQHRRTQHFQKLCEAWKRMKTIVSEDCAPHRVLEPWVRAVKSAEELARSAGASSVRKLRKTGIPGVEVTAFGLSQLRIAAGMCELAKTACDKGACAAAELMGQTHFMPFSLVCVGCSSRLWVYASHMESLVRASYDALYGLALASGSIMARVVDAADPPFGIGATAPSDSTVGATNAGTVLFDGGLPKGKRQRDETNSANSEAKIRKVGSEDEDAGVRVDSVTAAMLSTTFTSRPKPPTAPAKNPANKAVPQQQQQPTAKATIQPSSATPAPTVVPIQAPLPTTKGAPQKPKTADAIFSSLFGKKPVKPSKLPKNN